MKILIVDDEFVSRKKLEKIMESFGECDTAANGKEALEAYRLSREENAPYDIVTMDVMMPEMDGLETLKQLRAYEENTLGIGPGRGVKIIMVTSTSQAKTVIKSFYAGCEAYVIKPVDKDKLVKAMQELELDV